MDQYPGHNVLRRSVFVGCTRWLGRPAGLLFAIFAGVGLGFAAEVGAAPARGFSDNSPASLIQAGLGDALITTASIDKFAEALKQAVSARPTQAAAILTAALSVERKDGALIAGRLVGATIEGIGAKAGQASVTMLVRIGVELQPSAVLFIVRAAVRASPDSFAQAIVKSAVATLKNPSDQIIARIKAVAAKAKSGGDNDDEGLALVTDLEAVCELDQTLMLGEPVVPPPLPPKSTPTPTPTPRRILTPLSIPAPPPPPSL